MLDENFILFFAFGFAVGGILISLTFFLLFLPKMRELDKEFNSLRLENARLKNTLEEMGWF